VAGVPVHREDVGTARSVVPMAAPKQVFISHISSESQLAVVLKAVLDRHFGGLLDVFVSSDRTTIRAGRRWMDEVEQGLEAADLQIVLCSTESIGRPWVNFEAGAAWIRGLPIVPVVHSGMTIDELPAPLSFLQGIDCRASGLEKLFDTIADVLGVETPSVDFRSLGAEIHAVEEARASMDIVRVEHPRALCAATPQYAALGFDVDVDVVRSTFGEGATTVEAALSRDRLVELMTGEKFDIVHLVTPIDAATGDVVFDATDLATGDTAAAVERMSRDLFVKLLAEAGTRLTVLATCKVGLRLGTAVARVSNMAACDGELAISDAAVWNRFFYGQLRQGRSIHKAFELTREFCDVAMDSVAHQDAMFAVPARAPSP
jgi:TIR domain